MRVVTAFCLACICAELVSQLVKAGWARRCIKAVAGLYILTVLFRAAAALPTQVARLARPVQAPVSMASVEDTILGETSRRLEETLAAECEERFGISIRVETELVQDADEIRAVSAVLWVPHSCPAQVREQLVQFVQAELGMQAVTAAEEAEP